MTLSEFIADGGYKSRKFIFGIGCIIVLSVMVFAAAHYAAIAGLYSTFVGGVVGIYGIYAGVNVVNRVGTASKVNLVDKAKKADDDEKPAS